MNTSIELCIEILPYNCTSLNEDKSICHIADSCHASEKYTKCHSSPELKTATWSLYRKTALTGTLESSVSYFLSLKARPFITKQLMTDVPNLFLKASDMEIPHVSQVIYSIA